MKIRDIGLIIISGVIFRYGLNLLDFLFEKWTLRISHRFIVDNMKYQNEINDMGREEHKKDSYLTSEFPIFIGDDGYDGYLETDDSGYRGEDE